VVSCDDVASRSNCAVFHSSFVIPGTFHIAESGSDLNPDGSKQYVHMPQRNHKDTASRQMHVRRVPGRAVRADGKGVYYVRMKRPTNALGNTWEDASDEADTLAARQLGVPVPLSSAHSSAADDLAAVTSPSGVAASTSPSGLHSAAGSEEATQQSDHPPKSQESNETDDISPTAAGGWQQRQEGGAPPPTETGHRPPSAESPGVNQNLNSAFAGHVDELPV
jgi:hypothetical protein